MNRLPLGMLFVVLGAVLAPGAEAYTVHTCWADYQWDSLVTHPQKYLVAEEVVSPILLGEDWRQIHRTELRLTYSRDAGLLGTISTGILRPDGEFSNELESVHGKINCEAQGVSVPSVFRDESLGYLVSFQLRGPQDYADYPTQIFHRKTCYFGDAEAAAAELREATGGAAMNVSTVNGEIRYDFLDRYCAQPVRDMPCDSMTEEIAHRTIGTCGSDWTNPRSAPR